jgi:hypothetical protein
LCSSGHFFTDSGLGSLVFSSFVCRWLSACRRRRVCFGLLCPVSIQLLSPADMSSPFIAQPVWASLLKSLPSAFSAAFLRPCRQPFSQSARAGCCRLKFGLYTSWSRLALFVIFGSGAVACCHSARLALSVATAPGFGSFVSATRTPIFRS